MVPLDVFGEVELRSIIHIQCNIVIYMIYIELDIL